MIYFVQQGETGPIKIGHTAGAVQTRIANLQTASPKKLTLLAVAEGSTHDEAMVHARFAHLRLTGEWFRPGESLINYIFPLPTAMAVSIHPNFISLPINLENELDKLETKCILKAIEEADGNQTDAARLLKISFRSFRYRMSKHGL